MPRRRTMPDRPQVAGGCTNKGCAGMFLASTPRRPMAPDTLAEMCQPPSGDFHLIESQSTSKAQTALPKTVQEALAVGPRDRIWHVISGSEVRILAVRTLDDLFGTVEYHGPRVSLAHMDHAIAEGAQRR